MRFPRALLCSLLILAVAPAARAETRARHHMIVADSPYAAEAGLEMLRRGGTAVDAAIAAQMVLTLVEPESCGIGGGAFLLLWDPKTKTVTSFDGRETAPAAATPDMFLDANGRPRAHFDAVPGGLSVGVPGVVAMLARAHVEYGKLPWATLFAPAIRLAERGVKVPPKLAWTLRHYPQLARMPDIRRHFYKPDGTPLSENDTLKNPELAQTLRLIAQKGPRAFYTGPIAQSIVTAVHDAPVNPGRMTLSDLAHYRAAERKPVCGPYRGLRICSMGPPSSGGISVLQILGMLQRFPSSALRPTTLGAVHLFTQASRLAYADRAVYMGDPAFVPVPVAGLLDPAYLRARADLIDPNRDMGTAAPGDPPGALPFAPQTNPEHRGTSQISIVDDHGDALAMTTTVEFILGAEIMARGFILNNELTDFSFAPTRNGKPVANAPAPGKRPLSAMAPTLVFAPGGQFDIALGSPGGPAIIAYVAEALSGMIDGHLDPAEAAALPHAVNTNGPTFLEQGTALDALAPGLAAMGHIVRPAANEKSGLNIIARVKDGYLGAADPRRDGVALGD